jgi:hypothetical protein
MAEKNWRKLYLAEKKARKEAERKHRALLRVYELDGDAVDAVWAKFQEAQYRREELAQRACDAHAL